MNSLEKLIVDLKDSKDLIAGVRLTETFPDKDYGFVLPDIQQWHFIENAIQAAINRLIALSEELERGE